MTETLRFYQTQPIDVPKWPHDTPFRLVVATEDGMIRGEWRMPRELTRQEVEDFWAEHHPRQPIEEAALFADA